MKELLLVFFGGGLGSIARYLITKAYAAWNPTFPFATLTSNFISCLVFGFILTFGLDRMNMNPVFKLLFLTGFCGGLSTYSTFTFETVELFKNGNNTLAISNILINLFLSITALYAGIALAKLL